MPVLWHLIRKCIEEVECRVLGLNSGVFASVLRLASGAFVRLFHGNYRTTLMRTGTGPFGDLKTWRAGAMAGRVDAQFCHRKRFNLVIKMVSELASLRSRNCNDGINWCGCGLGADSKLRVINISENVISFYSISFYSKSDGAIARASSRSLTIY